MGGGANHAGLAGQLENLLGGSTCSMLFGAGPIEFRPDTLVKGNGQTSFNSVQYRAGKGNNIFLLPQKRALVRVELRSRDRAMVMEGTTCLLSRIGAASVAPASATGPRSAPAAAHVPQSAAPAAPTTGTVCSGAAFRCADGGVYQGTGCRGDVCDVTEYHLPAAIRFAPMSAKSQAQIAEQVKACEAGGMRFSGDNQPVFIR